jgi:poly-gamma-glutamate synthesis protein (capsule biosynthesis protein)
MFGRHVNRTLRPFGYNRPFRAVASLLREPDLTIGNLETPITSRQYFWMARSVLVFRAKPKAATILKRSGFDLMITANNHARDQKDRGLLETIKHLRKAGLGWVGTGSTKKKAFQPHIFKKNGISVGVLAAVNIRNYAREQRRGFFAYMDGKALHTRLPRMVAKLKKRVDFVVVSLHYGDEYRTTSTYRERRLMRRLVRAGCDVVFGGHPHVLRGIQQLDGSIIFHSLGNFLFDMSWKRTDETGIARVVLERDGDERRVVGAELVPVEIGPDFLPRPAKGRVARRILRRVKGYSKRFLKTTPLDVREGRLVVRMYEPKEPADSAGTATASTEEARSASPSDE